MNIAKALEVNSKSLLHLQESISRLLAEITKDPSNISKTNELLLLQNKIETLKSAMNGKINILIRLRKDA